MATRPWRAARALDQLLDEVNAAAPHRSKLSDGTIGDPAHSARYSDHNPNAAGVVRARDITHDPEHGVDGAQLAERIRQLGIAGHPALQAGAYVIHNRRIASATLDGAPWDWEPYSGRNPHTKHVHVSVSSSPRGYDSRRPWGVMAQGPNHVTRMREHIAAAIAQGAQVPATRAVVRAQVAALRLVQRTLPPR